MSSSLEYLKTVTNLISKCQSRSGYYYMSVEHFILEEGRQMVHKERFPDDIEYGELGYCFMNSFNLVQSDPERYGYCEGYATALGFIPLLHAWVIDRTDGFVIDRTWPAISDRAISISDYDYYGVEFPFGLVLSTVIRRRKYAIIDDYEGRWPLLREKFRYDAKTEAAVQLI